MTDMYYPIYAEGLYNSLMQVSTEQLALQSSGTLLLHPWLLGRAEARWLSFTPSLKTTL